MNFGSVVLLKAVSLSQPTSQLCKQLIGQTFLSKHTYQEHSYSDRTDYIQDLRTWEASRQDRWQWYRECIK